MHLEFITAFIRAGAAPSASQSFYMWFVREIEMIIFTQTSNVLKAGFLQCGIATFYTILLLQPCIQSVQESVVADTHPLVYQDIVV